MDTLHRYYLEVSPAEAEYLYQAVTTADHVLSAIEGTGAIDVAAVRCYFGRASDHLLPRGRDVSVSEEERRRPLADLQAKLWRVGYEQGVNEEKD